jgi:hypothetical protein
MSETLWTGYLRGRAWQDETLTATQIRAEFDALLAEHDRQVVERVGQKIQDLEHTRSEVKSGIRDGQAVFEWFEGYDTVILGSGESVQYLPRTYHGPKQDGSDVRGRR